MQTNAISSQSLRSIIAILPALLLVACAGLPSETAGRRVVENAIRAQRQGELITLVSFTKTNAVREGNSYRMEYDVEIEFREDCLFSLYGSIYNALRDNGGPHSADQVKKRKGERLRQSDVMTFEKTENGWRGGDGNIY